MRRDGMGWAFLKDEGTGGSNLKFKLAMSLALLYRAESLALELIFWTFATLHTLQASRGHGKMTRS